ncbi:hypothetical protein J6590_090960 [Homalodisca vitripennis]|nr:hypothetical protein J6590_090960 [Homalodisca vitripennis]
MSKKIACFLYIHIKLIPDPNDEGSDVQYQDILKKNWILNILLSVKWLAGVLATSQTPAPYCIASIFSPSKILVESNLSVVLHIKTARLVSFETLAPNQITFFSIFVTKIVKNNPTITHHAEPETNLTLRRQQTCGLTPNVVFFIFMTRSMKKYHTTTRHTVPEVNLTLSCQQPGGLTPNVLFFIFMTRSVKKDPTITFTPCQRLI